MRKVPARKPSVSKERQLKVAVWHVKITNGRYKEAQADVRDTRKEMQQRQRHIARLSQQAGKTGMTRKMDFDLKMHKEELSSLRYLHQAQSKKRDMWHDRAIKERDHIKKLRGIK